ncbi:MAG: TIR domain-containing protein [Anaerolineaceae bacterium]|nr:TIR domain-containing protein [Anaerolineaceae bacterium]
MLLFISHSSAEDEFVNNLSRSLERYAFETWVDHLHTIPAGQFWDEYVDMKLEDAKVMLLIWSPTASTSNNVSIEWREFQAKDKLIIPLVFLPAPLPLPIRHLQRIDFVDQTKYDEQLSLLINSLPKPALGATSPTILSSKITQETTIVSLMKASDDIIKAQLTSLKDNHLLLIFPNYIPETLIVEIKNSKMFIGRGLNMDINLENFHAEESGVSRQHAMLSIENGKLTLTDLNSINGTLVDRYRIPTRLATPLKNDSLIQLGTLFIRIYYKTITLS